MARMRGRVGAALAVALVLAGCGATPTASTATRSSPGATTAGGSSAAVPPAVSSSGFAGGSVAVTIVDGVRVRSRPGISAESALLEPLLPRAAQLFIVAGPVHASGYDWYSVAPLSRAQPQGWVAKGSREGIPWLATGSATCPAAPATVSALSALTFGQRLACFAGVSITVRGKFVNCECDVDGPEMDPSWFAVSEVRFLVDPAQPSPLRDLNRAVWVVLDPAGTYPDPVPLNRAFDVTGMFDHPAAAACTMIDGASREPAVSCRFAFAVTSIVPAG
jgi:hypothetical protein